MKYDVLHYLTQAVFFPLCPKKVTASSRTYIETSGTYRCNYPAVIYYTRISKAVKNCSIFARNRLWRIKSSSLDRISVWILCQLLSKVHRYSSLSRKLPSTSATSIQRQCSLRNQFHISQTSLFFTKSCKVDLLNRIAAHSLDLNVQLRGFKSRRTIAAEELRNPSLFTRLRLLFGSSSSQTVGYIQNLVQSQERKVNSKNLGNESQLTSLDHKLKIAFTNGYMASQHNVISASWFSVFLQVLTVFVFIVLIVSILISLISAALRARLEAEPEVLAEHSNVKFSDVRGADEAKQELQDVVEFLKNPAKFTALGGKLPKGILLVGPPGTGKTLLARAVAGEAGVPFFQNAGSEFEEVLVGQGARRVRDLFRTAKEQAPCVIFIDEIDSVGSKRTTSNLHPYANQTVNQLLSEMDGFRRNEGVIVLGATNRRDDLDSALLRPGRFDMEVTVSVPDLAGRHDILQLYLSQVVCDRSIDVDALARGTVGFTGADLRGVVNQAALRATIEGAKAVMAHHLDEARDRMLMGPELRSRVPDSESCAVSACHEAGHVVVAMYTPGGPNPHKVTIVPRGASLGHTAFLPEHDKVHQRKDELLAEMDAVLGGRAAEELFLGSENVTSGAHSDLKRATDIALNMVREWGMSEAVGPRTLDGQSQVADTEVQKILGESYERAKNVLHNHHHQHQLVCEALLKHETLNAEALGAILSDKNSPQPDTKGEGEQIK